MLENELQNAHACPAVGTQFANVCVPVTVKPFAIPGPVTVDCFGEPVIASEECCRGKVGQVCHFTISQKIKIEIPVDFGAAVKVGETFVDCDHFGISPGQIGPGNPNDPGCIPCTSKY